MRKCRNANKAEALRGGSWDNNPRNMRVSNRNRNEPGNRNNIIGLRCVGDTGNACPTVRPHQTSRLILRIDYGQTGFERRGL